MIVLPDFLLFGHKTHYDPTTIWKGGKLNPKDVNDAG